MSKTTTTTTAPAETQDAKEIPELKTHPATTKTSQIPALRLIADSVAQQRQTAARAVIFHPLFLSLMAALVAIVYKVLYTSQSDLPLIGTTSAGCVMAGLLGVRGLTGGYIEEAERVGKWAWLNSPSPEGEGQEQEQVVLVTQFGERVIGAVVLRGVTTDKKVTGVIRAWTVERRYRGKGVGVGLLEEAVQLCKEKGWEGPVFDEEHANAKRVLPGLFNGGFERREKWARKTLEGVKKRME
jgi:GNAT superfamily N-acetyltransferase